MCSRVRLSPCSHQCGDLVLFSFPSFLNTRVEKTECSWGLEVSSVHCNHRNYTWTSALNELTRIKKKNRHLNRAFKSSLERDVWGAIQALNLNLWSYWFGALCCRIFTKRGVSSTQSVSSNCVILTDLWDVQRPGRYQPLRRACALRQPLPASDHVHRAPSTFLTED